MLSRIAAVGALVLSCAAIMLAQQASSLEAYTDEDAYRIYDALLPQNSSGPTVVIEAETYPQLSVKNAHAFGPEECIDPSVAPEFKDAISDYNRLNQNKWLLQRKFALPRPYEIIDSATLSALAGDGNWSAFSQRFPKSRGVFQMSAVGFNKDKTRAVVYFGQLCGSLCGSWSFELLKKVDSKWVSAPGVMCHTVS